MRYRLSCDGQVLLSHQSAAAIEAEASYHAGTADHLDWQYDPDQPYITTAEYQGYRYQIEIIRWEDRSAG